jgi:hypothetical protein
MKYYQKISLVIVLLFMILAGCSETKKPENAQEALSVSDSTATKNKGAKIIIIDKVLPNLWGDTANQNISPDTIHNYVYNPDTLFWNQVDDNIPQLENLLTNENFEIKKQPVKNDYTPDSIDTLYLCTDTNSGNYFEYYYVTKDGGRFTMTARLKNNDYIFSKGIKTGISLKELLKILHLEEKETEIRQNGSFTIRHYADMISMEFLIKADTISQIELSILVD